MLPNLPSSILTAIFDNCDALQQATALGSSCRKCRSLWRSASGIILRLGRAEIRAFDDALIAVRATSIALKSFLNGELPPDPFPFHLLSPETYPPSYDELLAIFRYEHLVKCFENSIWHDLFKGTLFLEDFDEDPEGWKAWRVGFHASMYRLFLVGATLSSAYQHPFSVDDDARPQGFLHTLQKVISEEQFFVHSVFNRDDIQYLLKYPTYNVGDHEGHQRVFGPLADFLLRSSCTRAQDHTLAEGSLLFGSMGFAPPPNLDNNKAFTVFAELVQLLFAQYQLGRLYAKLVTYQKPNGECVRSRTRLREKDYSQPKNVTVILPGVFYPDQFYMPRRVEDAGERLSVRPVHSSADTTAVSARLPYENIDILLQCWHCSSGQPNKYDDFSSTHEPQYDFVQFLCQKHLGLRFSEEAFDPMKEESHFSLWEDELNVFDQTAENILAAAEMFTSADTEYEPYFEEMECTI
ncbi:hypothetical protein BDV59DRAFT_210294 [Aspergillus ambiguus]|uniref:uncharacterized protein n=1 Tax=Aspergillus ambiguus TaxID=176160 RepID=UPI003CCDF07C